MKSSTQGLMPKGSQQFFKGMIAMIPLSIAVIPWGILAGSMAVGAGLSVAKAVGMSALIFAGAAQLLSVGLVMAQAPVWVMVLSVFFLTSQHFIYALVFRRHVSTYSTPARLAFGFLLTDELFAIGSQQEQKDRHFLLGAGFCFYLFWVVFTYIGVLLANAIPNLGDYHLDFSIVAIFVPIVMALMKNRAAVIGVLSACVLAFVLTWFNLKSALIAAGLLGMVVAASIETYTEKKKKV